MQKQGLVGRSKVVVREKLYSRFKRLTAPRERATYFRSQASPRINIGSAGNRIAGWLNVDLFPTFGVTHLDASRPWPFADDCFDAALCEHMIEHVPKSLATFIVTETFRTLKPGGWTRIITPDMGWVAAKAQGEPASAEEIRYLDFLNRYFGRTGTTWCDAVNYLFYEHGHCYIWSIGELQGVLGAAGFVNCKVSRATEWIQPVFKDVEGHAAVMGADMDALEAFAIEAQKPLAANEVLAGQGS